MRPITELKSIDVGVVANLAADQEGMSHVANMVVANPALFLIVMGILKATNMNDQGTSSPAGDIGVAFSVGFLTAWHVCQQDAMDTYTEQLEAGEPTLPTVKDPVPVPSTILATFTELVGTCKACDGAGILAEGVGCEACDGMGHVPIKNVVDASPTPTTSLNNIDGIIKEANRQSHCDFEKTDTGNHEPESCPDCHGTGFTDEAGRNKCQKCYGAGTLEPGEQTIECEACAGAGSEGGIQCPECIGTGRLLND
jgi:hypothetical protein